MLKFFSKENRSQSLRIPGVLLALVIAILYLGSQKNFGAVQYTQFILDGLRGGAIYAMIAMGFVIVYNVTGVINFAQGAFVMLGAMLAVTFYEIELPLPVALRLIISIVLSTALTTVIGLLVERLTIHPARFSSPLTLIIITVGVFITIQGIALLAWGPDAHIYPSFTTLGMADKVFRVGGVTIKAQGFWIWGITAIVLILLGFFFEKTLLGKAMRACAINQRAARLVGIRFDRMSLLAFGMASALGSISGIIVAPLLRPSFDIGLNLGLKGFVAAIIGGLVSPMGAVLGGLLLGLIENVAAGVTKSGMRDIFAFTLLILTLLFRPHGLLGAQKTAVESGGESRT
jgi:branched-chain amino acid transport system permease protein